MDLWRSLSAWVLSAMVVVSCGCGFAQTVPAQPPPPPAPDGAEVLTRGPVHEAFAGTVSFDPQPGVVVPKAPPEAIEELPPDQKPEGTNVAWIPGYWSWDDERADFVWVSGVWRSLPPGRQWVAGYWAQTQQGYQWTSGYWADASVPQVEYLPAPPATVEVGPNINAPSADYSWIPGCWVWYGGRYAWRPGYWAAMQADWVWVPAHYSWTPRGHVFVGGYWDYAVARRGVLFAPVYFRAHVRRRHGFRYSPTTVIQIGVFTDHLFLRPRYGHYYFGDYYDSTYYSAGYYPWFSLSVRRYGYDPIYTHQRWVHRRDRDWERRVKRNFKTRRDHRDARPPRTWVEQRRRTTSHAKPHTRSVAIAAPLKVVVKQKNNTVRFKPIDHKERSKLSSHSHQVYKSRTERQKLETRPTRTPKPRITTPRQPARVTLPKSPIISKPTKPLRRSETPPKKYRSPKPDPDVEPRPRSPRYTPSTPRGKSIPSTRSPSRAAPKSRSDGGPVQQESKDERDSRKRRRH